MYLATYLSISCLATDCFRTLVQPPYRMALLLKLSKFILILKQFLAVNYFRKKKKKITIINV